MLRAGFKSIYGLFLALLLCTCIDPYIPKLKEYDALLVVEGLLTDANESCKVKLSRTFQDQKGTPVSVSDATVYITDNNGNSYNLNNCGAGIYKTDSLQFRGITENSYILHIKTSDGQIYESDQSLLKEVPEIDSIYFEKDQEVVNNGTITRDGIRIYLDSKGASGINYYRWDFEEIWKFKIPNPSKFIYINEKEIITNENIRDYCWKKMRSNDILIHSVYSAGVYQIKKEPIFFIASNVSDRLLLEYSILVKQYSISKKEYDFWNNLKKVNSSGADIFASQPFIVTSNIHNINNPRERVMGYFHVSGLKQKRKDIPFSDIVQLNLPFYHYQCVRLEKEPRDYSFGFHPPPTWDDIFRMFCVTSDYFFVEPKYIPGTLQLEKLVFTRPECADCTLTGTLKKPDF